MIRHRPQPAGAAAIRTNRYRRGWSDRSARWV